MRIINSSICLYFIFITIAAGVTNSTATEFVPYVKEHKDTKLCIVSHPLRKNPFPVIISDRKGYEIDCDNTDSLKKIIEGFGFDMELSYLFPSLNHDSDIISESNYHNHPKIRCNDQNLVLYAKYENKKQEDTQSNIHKTRYLIKFGNENKGADKLYEIECQGLIDALGLNTNDAQNLKNAPNSIRSLSTEIIHCRSGVMTGFPNTKDLWIIDIATGYYHTCILKANGKIECWGDDSAKYLKDFYKNHPDFRAEKIIAGDGYTCAAGMEQSANKGKSILCWGTNKYIVSNVPEEQWNDIREIYEGESHVCALVAKDAGTDIYCWGDNFYKQIDEHKDDNKPIYLTLKSVKDMALGARHSCIADNNGKVKCWGEDIHEKTTPDERIIPKNKHADKKKQSEYSEHDKVLKIVAGSGHTCALLETGEILCWGKRGSGENYTFPQIKNAKDIDAKDTTTCVLTQFDTVKCDNEINDPPPLIQAKKIAVGVNHICVIKKNGSVFCWGRNDEGQTDIPKYLIW
ncbi:MAG: hypothetical protein GY795_39205 [Desulfobacterales bacterium]|nr:hypothetical protein [Desulfobacterales bacterium]